MNSDWRTRLAAITEASNGLRASRPPEEEWGDAPSMIRAAEVILRDVRQGIENEIADGWEVLADAGARPAPVVGEHYQVVPQNEYALSFNTALILRDVTVALSRDDDTEATIARSLLYLQSRGALRFSWLISKLEPAFSSLAIALKETRHEVGDSDLNESAHVGRVVKKIKPVREALDE